MPWRAKGVGQVRRRPAGGSRRCTENPARADRLRRVSGMESSPHGVSLRTQRVHRGCYPHTSVANGALAPPTPGPAPAFRCCARSASPPPDASTGIARNTPGGEAGGPRQRVATRVRSGRRCRRPPACRPRDGRTRTHIRSRCAARQRDAGSAGGNAQHDRGMRITGSSLWTLRSAPVGVEERLHLMGAHGEPPPEYPAPSSTTDDQQHRDQPSPGRHGSQRQPASPPAATSVVARIAIGLGHQRRSRGVALGATNGVQLSVPRSNSVSDVHCVVTPGGLMKSRNGGLIRPSRTRGRPPTR